MRTLVSYLTLIAALVLISACSDAISDDAQQAAVQPVKIYQIQDTDSQRLRSFPAVVEAAEVAQLAFRVGGEITEFPVRPGTHVDEGQLIARLDPTDYQLIVNQAQAQYNLAEAQFNRTENLVAKGVVSAQQFDEVRANRDISKANLDTARANLGYTELRAPFAGTIAHVFVEKHETVQPQRPIATLQLDNAIDVSIRVPENLFSQVQRQTDYQPDVIFPAAPGERFKASLKEWDAMADPASNTFKVVFTLPTPPAVNLLPGMSATVLVDTHAVTAAPTATLLVPASAVFVPTTQPVDGGFQVWIYQPDSGTVTRRGVIIGDISSAGIEIIQGLAIGDQIVIAGVHQLSEGQQVRPWVKERGL
ncbi:RND transporter [Pseudidiomarina salinarum]|uniref:RND transporter n=1 Tax=Pseudidiomarina salinarum TaxID=435908 RepID=A0A094JFD6_9GAMM|nr:efflux RND transporter periplasmic adaptor subunit [Pseudidiomarina salinarum]KFZ31266.1 RND transporter [Pseudidiomarina salinarum]RUO70984.1 efflux RND transporter periplasmic adaptor subunit [Pseudidiomarina salinarum]